jgi:type II secretory pathway pseudopilin PulG
MKGFTVTELIVVIALVVLFTGLAIPALRVAQKNSELEDASQLLQSVLRLAQSRTLGSEAASQYGVFFDTAASPDQYILFRGATYATRDVAADELHILPKNVEMSVVAIPGNEVVFSRLTGTVANTGSVTLRLVSDLAKQETVYVSSSGAVQKTSAFMPSDAERQKDSRHVHADYTGRAISTQIERLRLVFSVMTYEIVIADNMQAGQIFWKGDILVDGTVQTLQIQTHLLNDPVLGTQFSIVRDKSKNTKAVNIEISGDSTGDLIRYDVQGQTTKGSSVYVALPLWQ